MPGLIEVSLPLPQPGELAYVGNFVSAADCDALVQDLSRDDIDPYAVTFDTRTRQPETSGSPRYAEGSSRLTGNSRSFVEAQRHRLNLVDCVENALGPQIEGWRNLASFVRRFAAGKGKPDGIDGVKDIRVIIPTEPVELVGQGSMNAGDAVVVNNLCGPDEQIPYGLEMPTAQAVLYFSFTR